jgi:hypothetical protein
MLGQFKPVAYEPYGKRRSGVPRWLVLLLCGAVIGAGGVVFVQERLLPQRLTIEASSRLKSAFDRAEAERKRLEGELAATSKRLETTLAENNASGSDLGAARANVQRLRDDVASVIAALPPDPRGGSVQVRAARFSVKGQALRYDVVLTREAGGAQPPQPLPVTLQLNVTGQNARGVETTVSLNPIQLTLGSHEVPRGSAQLPEGFKPRQAAVQVLDRNSLKQLGMRVYLVN